MAIREKVACEVTRYKTTHCRDHFHLNSKGHFFLLLSDASSQGRQIIGCETARTRLIYDLPVWHVALVLPVYCHNCL